MNNIQKILSILILILLFNTDVIAGCDDAPVDGVDYSNCQFSEGQDLIIGLPILIIGAVLVINQKIKPIK